MSASPSGPLTPPIAPMLASPGLTAVPDDRSGTCAFEPKWDGFRIIVFKDGDDVVLQGRNGDDLSYAFPEMVASCREHLPPRIVVDGELIIVRDGRLNFEALGARIRPRAESGRDSIARLAQETPTSLVAFDLLALGDEVMIDRPYRERRTQLVSALSSAMPPIYVTPATDDVDIAREWFTAFEGAGLDGLIIKDYDAPYSPGKRALEKIKHERTLDAVVAGWREHSSGSGVGSLLLGLYDDAGLLQHVGVVSGFSAKRRGELLGEIEAVSSPPPDHPWIDAAEGVRVPGGVSRWSKGRESSWHALAPELVVEVRYDSFEGDRLRHVAGWVRWRPDRLASDCGFGQVARPAALPVEAVLSLG